VRLHSFLGAGERERERDRQTDRERDKEREEEREKDREKRREREREREEKTSTYERQLDCTRFWGPERVSTFQEVLR